MPSSIRSTPISSPRGSRQGSVRVGPRPRSQSWLRLPVDGVADKDIVFKDLDGLDSVGATLLRGDLLPIDEAARHGFRERWHAS